MNPTQQLTGALVQYFKSAKGLELNKKEIHSIDILTKIIQTINENTPIIKKDLTVAPFKVRKIESLKIGLKWHKLELGTDNQVMILAAKKIQLGRGLDSIVTLAGKLLNTDVEIVQKLSLPKKIYSESTFRREKAFIKALHKNAKGHQRGIQRPPYRVRKLSNGLARYYAPAYKTCMGGAQLSKLLQKDMGAFGLNKLLVILMGVQDLLIGLDACHDLGIAHRDIKPENIGIQITSPNDRYEWVLADFGLATSNKENQNVQVVGTPGYLSRQEMIIQDSNKNVHKQFDLHKKQDMFGMGCSLLEIIDTAMTGNDSFNNDWRQELLKYYDETMRDKLPEHQINIKILLNTIEKTMGSEIRNLLSNLINPDPDLRPTVKQALEIWNHAIP